MKYPFVTLLCLALLSACTSIGEKSTTNAPDSTQKAAPPVSPTFAFVKAMGVGWNLGNALDAKGADETAWGNPKATKQLIDSISAKGFKTLRLPVTWQYHMGPAPDFTIEPQWLARVAEIVNYGLDNQMYVIINIHHDEEWLTPTYEQADSVTYKLNKVWTQVANHFKTYTHQLIFETLNETRLKGSPEEWKGGTAEGRDCINRFHQASVSAIRATGENNTDRYLMLSSYAASASQVAIDALTLPADTNLIVSIHNYYPYDLCLGEDGTDWGSDEDMKMLDAEFEKIHQRFVAKGLAVVMGEWGNMNHSNLPDRLRHASYYANGCLSRGICPIWWDNGNPKDFGIIDRNTATWIFPGIADTIVAASRIAR